MSRLTLYGFYNYDNTLFDGVVLPDGLDKPTLINEILKRGDLYTYHQSLEALKNNITFWFSRKSYDFEMLYKALRAEYNPIENYDRREEINRHTLNSGSDTTRASGSEGGQTTSSTTTSGSEDTHTGVSAYDSTGDYNDLNKTHSENESGAQSSSTNSSQSSNNSSSSYNSDNLATENNRVHGNIGVTTAQQMIREEVNLRLTFDLYREIANEFEKEFLIQVY